VPVDPLLLVPDFALILLGAALARAPGFSADVWRGLERLVYYVLLPPLLFMAIASAHFATGDAAGVLVAAGSAFGAGFLLAMAGGRLLDAPRPVFLSAAQTAFRFNSYLGLALASTLFGPAGLTAMALMVACGVPVANVLAVSLLARLRGAGPRGLAGELARNPLILGTLGGVIVQASGLAIPAPLAVPLNRLGTASLAIGLLCIGAGLRFGGEHTRSPVLAWFSVVKLVLSPALALAAAHLLALDARGTQVALLFAALPTAGASYILAARMGGDGPAVAFVITAQTLAAMLTLPLWVAVVPRLLG